MGPRDEGRKCDEFLCVHGFLDNAATFANLGPLLASSGAFRLWCVDLAGHGRSGVRSGGQRAAPGHVDHVGHRGGGVSAAPAAYHLADWALDILELADRLFGPTAPFSLLGHSLGSSVCMLTAIAVPDRVRQLVMIDAVGPRTGLPHEAPVALREAMAFRARESRRFPSLQAAAEHRAAMNWVGTMAVRDAKLLAERGCVQEKLTVDDQEHVSRLVYWDYDPPMRRPSPFLLTEPAVLALIDELHAVPTLVILARDGLFSFVLNSRLPLLPALLTSSLWPVSFLVWLMLDAIVRALYAVSLLSRSTRNKLMFAVHCGRRIARLKRCTKVVVMPGGGHHLHLAEAGPVAEEIMTWCRRRSNA